VGLSVGLSVPQKAQKGCFLCTKTPFLCFLWHKTAQTRKQRAHMRKCLDVGHIHSTCLTGCPSLRARRFSSAVVCDAPAGYEYRWQSDTATRRARNPARCAGLRHKPKDKQFRSRLKHRARHDRLTSLLVSAVLPFARIFCHYLFFFSLGIRYENGRNAARTSIDHTGYHS
jgi:hypothetical protein